jgi:DNA polymerase II large subunit
MTDYENIKYYIKEHEISKAEMIINHRLPDFAVNLRDYQFVRFFKSSIVIYYNLWKLVLRFDEVGNLISNEVEDLAIAVESD